MPANLPLKYELTFLDSEGRAVEPVCHLDQADLDLLASREMHFYEATKLVAERVPEAGIVDYSVRLLRPVEIREIIKIERCQRRAETRKEFWNSVTTAAVRSVAGDDLSAIYGVYLHTKSAETR